MRSYVWVKKTDKMTEINLGAEFSSFRLLPYHLFTDSKQQYGPAYETVNTVSEFLCYLQ